MGEGLNVTNPSGGNVVTGPKVEELQQEKNAPQPGTRITMADVARAADVSKALVSRVLNKVQSQIPIPEETIRRIERIAAELNYVPSRSARSLKKGNRLNLIGVSIRSEHPPYGATHSIEEALDLPPLPDEYRHPAVEDVITFERNFTVGLILDAVRTMADVAKWDLVIKQRNESSSSPLLGTDLGLDLVDGLLYQQPTLQRNEYVRFARAGYPTVVIGHTSGVPEDVSAIGIDNPKASGQIVSHLLQIGRKRLVGLWPHGAYLALSANRSQGFTEALYKNGLTPLGSYFSGPNIGLGRGYWLTKRVLELHPDLDGLVVGSEWMARGAVYALQESGRRVPDDVSVVNFDDTLLSIIEPPHLTAIRIPFAEIYSKAVALLLDLIQGNVTGPVHIELEPKLIVRESCGAALLSSAH